MSIIKCEDVFLGFPLYNTHTRSFKKRVLNTASLVKGGEDVGGRSFFTALNKLSFELSKGERVALLGDNGAGKTTLLRLLNGIYFPSSGCLTVRGKCSSLVDIGLGIDPEASGMENIYLRGRLLGLSKQDLTDSLEKIIDFSELGEFIHMPVRTYSSGMQLRLAFSIVTTIPPDILLMDEWLSVGDESFREKAEEKLLNMVQASNLLVLASHSRELIEKVCTRAIWLENGSVKLDGDPKSVCEIYFKS